VAALRVLALTHPIPPYPRRPSQVLNKGKVYKTPVTPNEALASPLMGMIEKFRARGFFRCAPTSAPLAGPGLPRLGGGGARERVFVLHPPPQTSAPKTPGLTCQLPASNPKRKPNQT
jgi:hypothetical protein